MSALFMDVVPAIHGGAACPRSFDHGRLRIVGARAPDRILNTTDGIRSQISSR